MRTSFKSYLLLAMTVFLCIFAALIVGIATALSPENFWQFLEGKAADWVQAVGSILAIAGAYYFGQLAHRQQTIQEKRREALQQLDKAVVLRELFEFARVMNSVAGEIMDEPVVPLGYLVEITDDFLITARSVSIFDLPSPDMVRHLSFARQTALAYKKWMREANPTEIYPVGLRKNVKTQSARGIELSEQAIALCDRIATEARQTVNRLS